MPFWHYDPDDLKADRSIQPISPLRRTPYVRTKVEQPKRSDRHAESEGFETSEAVAAYRQQQRRPGKRKLAVRAEQIMSAPVVSIKPDTRLQEVRRIVKERRFRHIPVVADNGWICGIVSDRDLLALPGTDGADESPGTGVAADIMIKKVLTATPDTNIREIARVLFEERIGCMPIVDEDKQVVGIITRSDILRALIKHAPLDLWI